MNRKDKYSQFNSIIWSFWQNGWVFIDKLSGCGFASHCTHINIRYRDFFENGVPWYSDKNGLWFTLKGVRENRRTHSQINHKDMYTQFNSIISSVWLNCWVFVNELSGCGFETRYIHLNFRYRACFEFGPPWHSGKYRVWIHSEIPTFHENKKQPNAPYR